MSKRAWVTLATNDSYGLGALVLAHSLRRVGSAYPAVVLITPSVTEAMRDRLGAVFAEVITVDVLDSRDAAHLALLQRPELGITFTKIHCWNLTQYDKCVFLDADALMVQNSDELFEREELSAAPDVGWPDCFNSGVFVYSPSADTFDKLIKFAQERGSFDGGDQGLLNSFFSDWARGDINKHLPFLYNVTSAAFYSYMPALKHYGQNLKIIHFIGAAKPWLQHFNWGSGTVDAPEHLRQFLQLWWDLFVADVHANLDVSMSGVAGNLARVSLGSSQREAIDDLTRRQGWEAGNIDYMGVDSFDNIWAKISQTLSQPRPLPPKQSPPRELDQPQTTTDQVEIQMETVSCTTAPVSELIEVAKEVLPIEESTTVKSPTETIATESTVTAIPTAEPTEIEPIIQSEITAVLETAAPTETPMSNIKSPLMSDTYAPATTHTVVDIPPTVQQVVSEEKEESAPLATTKQSSDLLGAGVPVTSITSTASKPIAASKQTNAIELVTTTESMTPLEPVKGAAPITTLDLLTTIKPPNATEFERATEPATATELKIETDCLPSTELTATVEKPVLSETPSSVEKIAEVKSSISESSTSVEAPVIITEAVSIEATSGAPKTIAPPTVTEVPSPEIPVSIEAITPTIVSSTETAAQADTAIKRANEKTVAPFSEADPEKSITKIVKAEELVQALPASAAVIPEAPVCSTESTPEKVQAAADTSSDSPPLAHTPSKEEILDMSPAKSAERRKPAGKLQLSPPVASDMLPTPDSELEDAATLAQSIIASELRTPTVTTPGTSPLPISPPAPLQHSRLSVDEPEVPTPPVGAVSLSQIGVKTKGKTTTAAQIESSVTEKAEPATPTSPIPELKAATPKTKSVTASPKTKSPIATPKTESSVTTSTAESKTATPKTECVATTPKTESLVVSSKTKSTSATPKIESTAATPKTESSAAIPKTESGAATPKTEFEAATPKREFMTAAPDSESVVTTPKAEPLTATPKTEPMPAKSETTSPAEVPKKKVVKKVVKKVSATGGDAPVPPPRKKEKKPKE